MSTVHSKDGTRIAYDVRGTGRPLVIVDGATAYRATDPTNGQLADLLADEFRTYTYDRRGRGESTDTAPYATERELEDLAALIADAGAPAVVFAWSSGGLLALDAAAAGLPIEKLVVFEPPVIVGDGRPPAPADYVERLDRAVAEGRPGDAAELFLTAAAGLPAEAVAGIRQSPYWPVLEAVAPTIAYDGRFWAGVNQGRPVPLGRWAPVDVPTLVLYGNGTEPWLRAGARAAAEAVPGAKLAAVEGQQHSAAADVLAPAIRHFVLGSDR
jgi:pimeloyl-ACP methyl ester carboxylesterase